VASHFWLFAILEFVLVFATSIVGQNKEMALPGFILLNVFTFITGFTLAPILSFALVVNSNAIVYAKKKKKIKEKNKSEIKESRKQPD